MSLRISLVDAVDSTNIKVSFTDNLNLEINTDNVSIVSETPNIDDPKVLISKVNGNVLELQTQPLTPLAAYNIVFKSTNNVRFKSLNGQEFLVEDGQSNKKLFTGPVESDNLIKTIFQNYFLDSVYDTSPNTLIGKLVDALSILYSKGLYDISQLKNENYLSFKITDEQKVRGPGPFDRLTEGGAYEILRVGKQLTGAQLNESFTYDPFPTSQITLNRVDYTEQLVLSSSDSAGTFNINNFVLNFNKSPVYKLKSVNFTYTDGHAPYDYDIEKYGYQILESKYDPEFAFTYFILEDNQIKLNDKILLDSNFKLENVFRVNVSYEYKNLGKKVDPLSVEVSRNIKITRETIPPLRNIFNLKYAPIVTANDSLPTLNGITFLDPNQLPDINAKHPAFLYEIVFRLDNLPSKIGDYAIDYSTGTVYVFGQDKNGTGTGEYPPLATYHYKNIFTELTDYVYESDTQDLAVLSNGSIGNEDITKVSFKYESALIPNIDFKANVHNEILGERVENRILNTGAIKVKNAPITNVFRVFNETSGELYNITRWSHDKIEYSFNQQPRILTAARERSNFETISNELLIVNSIIDTPNPLLKIFKILLTNNNIISATEDCIGSSLNTSVTFSDSNLFENEYYFDPVLTESQNLLILDEEGKYKIDYVNGVVYSCLSVDQDFDIGTINYKKNNIITNNKHLVSIEDIYYQDSPLVAANKILKYVTFDDTGAIVDNLESSNERFLSNLLGFPYIVSSGQVGTIIDSVFVSGVTDNIKSLRVINEYEDLRNNASPLNFALNSSFSSKNITVAPIERVEYLDVKIDINNNYYIDLNTNLEYLSPNIIFNLDAIRVSDNVSLYQSGGSYTLGSPIRVYLSLANSPVVGDLVKVTYSFTISDASNVVIDYNRGDLFIDYTYLADEIIVSYEYGDNVIDFRTSDAISQGETYYVTYKAGALRDALLKNFGSLVNIPVLNTFDITFERERYRDALAAALHSFIQGPTLSAMKDIAFKISHAPPEVIESAFNNWSLGNSLLNLQEIKSLGEFNLPLAKFGRGVLVDSEDQRITFPASSNLRLEEGTLHFWTLPQWNGIDNDSNLKISIKRNGAYINENEIFIGSSESHPVLISENSKQFFEINKTTTLFGVPNKNKNGVFIYYNKDISSNFNRWNVEVIDGYSSNYTFEIQTNGKFYDVKPTIIPKPSNISITSGTNLLKATISGTNHVPQGITFVADYDHYLFDFGNGKQDSRFSIYKDSSGYLNFRVIDKNNNIYSVSSDVSHWKNNEKHHVAVSWKLNSKNFRDEMHLFIDGFEVANIIKYGSKILPYLHEKFRTINPEEIAGVITKNIVASNDMVTNNGSFVVTSSLNFSAYGINIGDTLFIEEPGTSTLGYTITNVNGNALTLDSPIYVSFTDAKFSVNKTTIPVTTEIAVYPNIAVSLLHYSITDNDLSTIYGSNIVSTSNALTGVLPGYLLRINNLSFEKHYTILNVSGGNITLDDEMPTTLSGLEFYIYPNLEEEIAGVRALSPDYEIQKIGNQNYLIIKNNALENDLVFIETLGINHKRIKRKYYAWGNSSNIIGTRLPPPISLDDLNIYKVILANTNIGSANSTLNLGQFQSINLATDQPSNSDFGRTLAVGVFGNNIDFSTPVEVEISGVTIDINLMTLVPILETLTFNEPGIKYTNSLFTQIDYANVLCQPLDISKNCCVVDIKEKYSITQPENNALLYPVVRYSYQVRSGAELYGIGDGYVNDSAGLFSTTDVGNHLIIYSPPLAAGSYKIIGISEDRSKVLLQDSSSNIASIPAFSMGVYEILNATTYRSGLQNGYFTFELNGSPGQPYLLQQGSYEFDYYTYLNIPFKPFTDEKINIGTDIDGKNPANSIIDELKIYSTKLTDTRIGETSTAKQRTITKDFNSVKPLNKDKNTLSLVRFDNYPFLNDADYYSYRNSEYIQSGISVNDNFNQSVCLVDKPINVDNAGILNTKTQGTIEFWINPFFDSQNDPNERFYFDAASVVTEEIVSNSNSIVNIVGKASKILRVSLKNGSNFDYFAGGTLKDNRQTIILNRFLPNQNSNILVHYIPSGVSGDRISIYKDSSSSLVFNLRASAVDYQINVPIFWTAGSWHRVKASYKVNGGKGHDEIRLFVDGYERGNYLFGDGLLFGNNLVFGSSYVGQSRIVADMKFRDSINEFKIGSDYSGLNIANALIDNFRISNISRPLYMPYGESIDVNYNSNISANYPVTEDLYTTYLMDFDTFITKNDDFSVLKNKKNGLFDFTINIFDSFGIVSSSNRVKEVLETLIKTLKPANSRVSIKYTK